MCGESASLFFPLFFIRKSPSARSLLSVRSPSVAGKLGEQLFGKPLWADHSASPPGENGVYSVYGPLSGNCPMLLDMQKVRFKYNWESCPAANVNTFHKNRTGYAQFFTFPATSSISASCDAHRPKLRRFVFL